MKTYLKKKTTRKKYTKPIASFFGLNQPGMEQMLAERCFQGVFPECKVYFSEMFPGFRVMFPGLYFHCWVELFPKMSNNRIYEKPYCYH